MSRLCPRGLAAATRLLAEAHSQAGTEGVLLWMIGPEGSLLGALVGPPVWPIPPAVLDLLVAQLVDEGAVGVVVTLTGAPPGGVTRPDAVSLVDLREHLARDDLRLLGCRVARPASAGA